MIHRFLILLNAFFFITNALYFVLDRHLASAIVAAINLLAMIYVWSDKED